MTKEKAIGLFRLRMNGVFQPFNCYGLTVLIPEAIEAVIKHAMQLHKNLKDAEYKA